MNWPDVQQKIHKKGLPVLLFHPWVLVIVLSSLLRVSIEGAPNMIHNSKCVVDLEVNSTLIQGRS